jgi:hypothetical protein
MPRASIRLMPGLPSVSGDLEVGISGRIAGGEDLVSGGDSPRCARPAAMRHLSAGRTRPTPEHPAASGMMG